MPSLLRKLCSAKTTEHTDKKSKIIQQIRGLGALLKEKQSQIDKLLSEKAKKVDTPSASNPTIDNLYKVIEFLSSQLKEKRRPCNPIRTGCKS